MVTFFLLLIVGILAGTAGRFLGIGGGFIIIPALIFIYPKLGMLQVSSFSLLCVLINALMSFLIGSGKKQVQYRLAVMLSLTAVPGSILGATYSKYLPLQIFQFFLALLFFITSILLFKNTRKTSSNAASLINESAPQKTSFGEFPQDANSHKPIRQPVLACIGSFFIGALSSIFGIGGGIFYFPMFVKWMQMPVQIATATSLFALLITSFFGCLTFWIHGVSMIIYPSAIWMLPLGVGIGVWMGNHFSSKAKPIHVIRIFSFIVFLTGIRILLLSIGK